MTATIPASALDFAAIIRPGDVVVCGQATSEALTLTEALVAQAPRLPPFTMVLGPLYSQTFAAADLGQMSFRGYGVIGNSRPLAKAGRFEVVPSHYSAFNADFASGRHRADVVLIQLSSRAPARGLSSSLANDYVRDAARRARVVIAEINPDAPWTHGAAWPEDIPLHLRIAASKPPLQFPAAALDDVSRRIGANAATLIDDGATLQFGVGKIPEAIIASLGHLQDLGVHSGLLNDAIADYIERGVVTNRCKGLDDGISVTNLVMGTRQLYDFVHENAAVSVRPASYTHGHRYLAQLRKFTSINGAIEVGLDGSVNAETANGIYMGAVGGQVDFVRGANASIGGRAIIALPATGPKGISRIVPRVETVTTPRSDVDAIVTEWGVAELRGCTLTERARKMVTIAAPEHREALECAAFEMLRRG